MNKKGLTILELIVYIALAAFLIAPVIFLVHKSSINMARDNSSTVLRSVGTDVLNILYDDLKNTGFKVMVTNTSPFEIMVDNEAFYSDSSSFIPEDGQNSSLYDKITIIKGVIDEDDIYQILRDTIEYYVDDQILWRRIRGNSPSTQKVAFDVEALQFQYSTDLSNWHDSPEASAGASTSRKKIKFVRVYLVLNDQKQLSPDAQSAPQVQIANATLNESNGTIREIHQTTVPIPNNGLFP